MIQIDNLLRCPCCGHNSELNSDLGMHQIQCTSCGVGSGIFPSVMEAVDTWTKRRTDGFEAWLDAEVEKAYGIYHREKALRECRIQIRKMINGIGVDASVSDGESST